MVGVSGWVRCNGASRDHARHLPHRLHPRLMPSARAPLLGPAQPRVGLRRWPSEAVPRRNRGPLEEAFRLRPAPDHPEPLQLPFTAISGAQVIAL